jgi:hypothetical protein
MCVVRERCLFSVCWLGYPVSFGSRLFLFGFRSGSWFPVFLWCICDEESTEPKQVYGGC